MIPIILKLTCKNVITNSIEKKYVLRNFPWGRTAVYLSVSKKFVFTLNLGYSSTFKNSSHIKT